MSERYMDILSENEREREREREWETSKERKVDFSEFTNMKSVRIYKSIYCTKNEKFKLLRLNLYKRCLVTDILLSLLE